MSVGSELDVDVQDLLNQVDSHRLEFPNMDPLDLRAELLEQLLKMGWLPPTYTEHVKAKVKQAYEAIENDEAFKALRRAAGVLRVELVDPMADPLNSVTLNSMTLNSMTLGKVA